MVREGLLLVHIFRGCQPHEWSHVYRIFIIRYQGSHQESLDHILNFDTHICDSKLQTFRQKKGGGGGLDLIHNFEAHLSVLKNG